MLVTGCVYLQHSLGKLNGILESNLNYLCIETINGCGGAKEGWPHTNHAIFVDGCYARLLLLYTYRGFSTTTQGQSTCRYFGANLEEISRPGYKTLQHFFGAVR